MTAYRYIEIILLLFLMIACNNDIFVDPVPEIESEMFLDCNGASHSFEIQKKGLLGVSFCNNMDSWDYVSFYDRNGDEIYSPDNIDEVARIIYQSSRFILEFQIIGNNVKAVAVDNTYDTEIIVEVSLNYESGSASTKIHVSPGEKMLINDFRFDDLTPAAGMKTTRDIPMKFKNFSDTPQRIGRYPYQEMKSKVEVVPEDFEMYGLKCVAEIPYHVGGEWREDGSNPVEIKMGEWVEYLSPNADISEYISIEIPPNSAVTTVMTVTYATFESDFSAWAVMPASDCHTCFKGHCRIEQPVAYDLEVVELVSNQ